MESSEREIEGYKQCLNVDDLEAVRNSYKVCIFLSVRNKILPFLTGGAGQRRLTCMMAVKRWLLVVVYCYYTQGEVTSQSLWSRYDRRFLGIIRDNALG